MAKRPLIRSAVFPYHINARANNKEWFSITPDSAWKIFSDLCFGVTVAYGARFHSFVLMSNHFHGLISTPDKNIDQIMNYFMREASRKINFISNRVNHVFGGTYHRGLITSAIHYGHVYKYIYRNPIVANLCNNVEDYPYSTFAGIFGKQNLQIPLWKPQNHFDMYTSLEYSRLTEWLNAPSPREHTEQIAKAMKKAEFKFGRNPTTLRASYLDSNLF